MSNEFAKTRLRLCVIPTTWWQRIERNRVGSAGESLLATTSALDGYRGSVLQFKTRIPCSALTDRFIGPREPVRNIADSRSCPNGD